MKSVDAFLDTVSNDAATQVVCAHAHRHCRCRGEHPSNTNGGDQADGFPSRTVTLFAPDDYYLGTRKFMDLLIAAADLARTRRSYRGSQPRRWGFAYDENANRTCCALILFSASPPPRPFINLRVPHLPDGMIESVHR